MRCSRCNGAIAWAVLSTSGWAISIGAGRSRCGEDGWLSSKGAAGAADEGNVVIEGARSNGGNVVDDDDGNACG